MGAGTVVDLSPALIGHVIEVRILRDAANPGGDPVAVGVLDSYSIGTLTLLFLSGAVNEESAIPLRNSDGFVITDYGFIPVRPERTKPVPKPVVPPRPRERQQRGDTW